MFELDSEAENILLQITNNRDSYNQIIDAMHSYRDGTYDDDELHTYMWYGAKKAGIAWGHWNFHQEKLKPALYEHYSEEVFGKWQEHPLYPSTIEQETIKKEETKMIKIETITYVNDEAVSDLSDDDIIKIISTTEGEIKKLKGIETKSKTITAKIEELTKNIEDLVAIMDTRG